MMCNRYSREVKIVDVWKRFHIERDFDRGANNPPQLLEQDYNIAPQSLAAAVFAPEKSRELNAMIFGLAPSWCYGKAVTNRFTNARAETLTSKPAFKDLLPARRCLIPATGFFEWRKENGRHQPYHFRLKGGAPFAFAALWDVWRPSDAAAPQSYSFAIVTTAPNELCAAVHDRMPVILDEEAEQRWLDPDEKDAAKLLPLLKPFPAGLMESYPVTPQMSYARFNERRCVEAWDGSMPQLKLLS